MSNNRPGPSSGSKHSKSGSAGQAKSQHKREAQRYSSERREVKRTAAAGNESDSVRVYSRKNHSPERKTDFSEPAAKKQTNNRIAVNNSKKSNYQDDFVDISKPVKAAPKKQPVKKKLEGRMTEVKSVVDNRVIPRTNTKKRARKKLTKRVVISIISCILAVIMMISGTGCIVMYSYLNSINYQSIDTDSSNSGGRDKKADTSGQNTKAYEGKLLNDKQILNILLIGADTRKGQTKGLSDTMILFSIDTKHKKLKMLSLQRDTWVVIPGYGENKLNSAFTLGGAELTVKTIQANYGIQIDRYAIVDFKSFKKIIDKLGGIDVELTQEEVDYIDWQTWSNHQADTRNELDASSYDYKPNKNGDEVALVHLNGRQALWHARNRGEEGICSGDDYVRTLRQRNVISIMINKIKKSETTKILETLSDIGSMVTTNFKSSEILQLAQNITKYLKYEIVSQSAPDSKSYDIDYWYSDMYEHPVYVYGDFVAAILIIDWQDFRGKIADFIFNDENKLKPSENSDSSEKTEDSDDKSSDEQTG